MTNDEHVTRAMLMGMEYDWRTNTYFRHGAPAVTPAYEVDADTLDPIDIDEVKRRMKHSDEIGNEPEFGI